MFFSKSFGYAIRAILYIALVQPEGRKIYIEEVAEKLSVPRHFLGKIMQELVRHRLLKSTKGPYGGFELDPHTLAKPLLNIFRVTDDPGELELCGLRFNKCNKKNPCPIHDEIRGVREKLILLLSETTIGDLMSGNKKLTLDNISL